MKLKIYLVAIGNFRFLLDSKESNVTVVRNLWLVPLTEMEVLGERARLGAGGSSTCDSWGQRNCGVLLVELMLIDYLVQATAQMFFVC